MIGQYKTFADYLVDKGVRLPSDTVVIKTSCLWDDNAQSIVDEYDNNGRWETDDPMNLDSWEFLVYLFETLNVPCRPIFTNVFVEWEYTTTYTDIATLTGSHMGVFFETRDTGDGYVAFHAFQYDLDYANMELTMSRSPLYWLEEPYISLMQAVSGSDSTYPHEVRQLEPAQYESIYENDHDTFFALRAFSLMHLRTETELITPSRGDKRRAKKAGIKEPSPYFLLRVDPTKPRKVYEVSGNHTGQKNRAHIVRGHFRTTENHPIEHFNGTQWIPAHMRGDKDKGIVNKGYRIVLPDNDESDKAS